MDDGGDGLVGALMGVRVKVGSGLMSCIHPESQATL